MVEQIVRENRCVLFHTTLSIDGVGADQDDLRGNGQWKQTVATWEKLRGLRKRFRNLRVSVQMTVSRLNIGKALPVMDRFAKESDTFIVAFAMENQFYRAEDPRVPQVVTIKKGTTTPVRAELDTCDIEAVRTIIRRYPLVGPGSLLEKLFLAGMLRRMRQGSAGVPCVAGDRVVFISAKGDVKPCPFFDEAMGHLKGSNFDVPRLLKTPAAARVRSAARNCENCWNNCVALPSLVASPAKALRLLASR